LREREHADERERPGERDARDALVAIDARGRVDGGKQR
jgi:hypothetical protein